jgi:hypothetical protein
MKHTPGPWTYYDTGYGIRICPESCMSALIPTVAASHNQIARLKPDDALKCDAWDAEWEVVKANAKLMAAAPEMLEMLIRLSKSVYGLDENQDLLNLIKKAKGQ